MSSGGDIDFIKCKDTYPIRFYRYDLIYLINTYSSYTFTKKPLLSSIFQRNNVNDTIININTIKDILKVLSSYAKVDTISSTNNSCIIENKENCDKYGKNSLSCPKLQICNNIKILFNIFPEVCSKILSDKDITILNEHIEKMKTFKNDEEYKMLNNRLICHFKEFLNALGVAIGQYTTYIINEKPRTGGKQYKKRVKKVN